jgi:putative membrane-bound dehydrogenase-like protein
MKAPSRKFLCIVIIGLLAAAHDSKAAEANGYAAIQVPPGFEVTPVAGSPLVKFPVMAGFDERGRLFVAENAGVNLDQNELAQQKPSRITVLEDTDGDGVFDRSSVFVDQLTFPQGAQWHDGALYVASPPSIWRFEDKDGDGRAETRTEIATGFKFTGNAADVHGPFLHPNGRLYWCHGRKGHEVYQNGGGALVSKALGARIWSCRPDGTDIQVHAGGGMDNPTEVTFNQEGEIFGTVNIFHGSPRADAVLHWVYGGVYPRVDQQPVIAEFRQTGDLLPPITLIGHVAPAGLVYPRSDTWGADYRNNVFLAEFNTHRIMRVPLERSGATYRGRPEVFASTNESNVHFTDVIEDADGSLLVIDTGAWFRRGCPTSVVARADVLGAIYRIRKTGVRPPDDSRGLKIAWASASVPQLVELLGDPRVAVRDRALTALGKRGDVVVPALAGALNHKNHLVRSNAVWALTRIATPSAQAAARRALLDHDPRIREVGCQSAFITNDREAADQLVTKLADDSPSVQREAARALGRLREPRTIPALGAATAGARDPVLSHALILALIEIDAPAETRKLLASHNPRTWRAALLALGQGTPSQIDPESVFKALRSSNEDLQKVAVRIAVRHREWGHAAAEYLSATLASAAPPSGEIIPRLLAAFLPTPEVRGWARTVASADRNTALVLSVLLHAIASSTETWDDAWRDFLATQLRSPDSALSQAALRAMDTHRSRDFSAVLREVGQDSRRPTALRVAALQLAAGATTELDAASFKMLVDPFISGGASETRLQAASVLAGAKLSRNQVNTLIDILPGAGPIELPQLLSAFQRAPSDADTAARLLSKLQVSPSRWGLQPSALHQIFQRYPTPAHENAASMIREIANQNVAKDGRIAELELIVTDGDAARGKVAFETGAGACVSCHRIGGAGGTVGPDLSHIGRIRTTRDLLEAISFPSATIARGYESFQLALRDGRTVVGTIPRETADTLFVRTADGAENAIPRNTIAKLEPATTSLMPPGLDRVLEPKALADLVAFLKTLQ